MYRTLQGQSHQASRQIALEYLQLDIRGLIALLFFHHDCVFQIIRRSANLHRPIGAIHRNRILKR